MAINNQWRVFSVHKQCLMALSPDGTASCWDCGTLINGRALLGGVILCIISGQPKDSSWYTDGRYADAGWAFWMMCFTDPTQSKHHVHIMVAHIQQRLQSGAFADTEDVILHCTPLFRACTSYRCGFRCRDAGPARVGRPTSNRRVIGRRCVMSPSNGVATLHPGSGPRFIAATERLCPWRERQKEFT